MTKLVTALRSSVAAVFLGAVVSAQAPAIPYRQPDRLVAIRGLKSSPSLADLRDFAAGMPTLLSLEAFRLSGGDLIRQAGTRIAAIGRVTDGWFDQMGLPFVAGQSWRRGERGVVVVSAAFAKFEFTDVTSALGKVLQYQKHDGFAATKVEDLRIVGVFEGPAPLPTDDSPIPIEVFRPYEPDEGELEARGPRAVTLIGRLRDPAQFDLAAKQAESVATKLADTYPRNRGAYVRLVRLQDELRRPTAKP